MKLHSLHSRVFLWSDLRSTKLGSTHNKKAADPIGSYGFMIGGEGGIRTPGTLASTSVFETDPFDHSGTSPNGLSKGPQR